MTADLRELALEACAWMTAQSPQTQSEAYLSCSSQRRLSRRDGEREAVETAAELGAGVRVVRGGRVGFASAGGADLETLKGLWRRAWSSCPMPRRRRGGSARPVEDRADTGCRFTLGRVSSLSRRILMPSHSDRGRSAGGRVLRGLAESRGGVVVASTRASAGAGLLPSRWSRPRTADRRRSERASSRAALWMLTVAAGARARSRRSRGRRPPRAGRRAFEPWVAEF